VAPATCVLLLLLLLLLLLKYISHLQMLRKGRVQQ
jgi:hypothetical protein